MAARRLTNVVRRERRVVASHMARDWLLDLGMARLSTAPVYVSRNHLGGSFIDVPLDGILAGCFRQQVTGAIEVECDGLQGRINLRAGAVTTARFGDTAGPRALHEMRQLVDGRYEITQRLPD